MRSKSIVSMGVDLAGSESRPTGLCILINNLVRVYTVRRDQEIIQKALSVKPDVIAIDAPLALPKGKNLNSKNCIRECDKALRKMGIKFFPINFGGMRKLTIRGIRLREILIKLGFDVIETYPGAAQDILGLPRAKRNLEGLRLGLIKMFNLKGDIIKSVTKHEADAITCAIVGRLYLEGKYLALGDSSEILMILPNPSIANQSIK